MAQPVVYTTAGLAALTNAQETGFAPVVIASAGLSAIEAGDTATIKGLDALPGEFKRATAIGGELVGDALIHVTATDVDGEYTLRSVGFYTDDDVLLAVVSAADPLFIKTEIAALVLAFYMPLLDAVAPGTVTIEGVGVSVPPATRTLRGVIELATPSEVLAGQDDERAVTPFTLKPALRRSALAALFIGLGQ